MYRTLLKLAFLTAPGDMYEPVRYFSYSTLWIVRIYHFKTITPKYFPEYVVIKGFTFVSALKEEIQLNTQHTYLPSIFQTKTHGASLLSTYGTL